MEIDSVEELLAALSAGVPPAGMRLQGLDLRGHDGLFQGRTDIEGMVVLGGALGPALTRHLIEHGAIVFPPFPHAPIDPYRSSLYDPRDLYDGLFTGGYATTPDARAYAWSRVAALEHDVFVSVLRATHDVAMADALDDLLVDRAVVGVMGGHNLPRDGAAYRQAAFLGHAVAAAGRVVATGGGPGAMEAANLGALAPDVAALEQALDDVSAVPSYLPSIGAWARSAFTARERLLAARDGTGAGRVCSVGIPTWFYGHEPPNVFCDGIAKFFSNALREDGLLARSRAGTVVLPGAAGTVQEIFQAVTPLYYADPAPSGPLPPLVLVGVEHWTERVPAWPLLTAMSRGRRMAEAIRLVDTWEDAADIIDT